MVRPALVILLVPLALLSVAAVLMFAVQGDEDEVVVQGPQPVVPEKIEIESTSNTDSLPRESKERYYRSLFQNDPSTVQEGLLSTVREESVDIQSKANAYFVTHRYIDNGGNIYELYDFFARHPELVFINTEAAKIRPEIFDQIEKRRAPSEYSDQGIYAYLAYLEVLERHGYANIAMTSTAANQYAKLAYYKTGIRKEKSAGDLSTYPDYSLEEINSDIKKARFFLSLSDEPISWLMSGESSVAKGSALPLDIFYGMEQYGSALRYLTAYGKSPEDAKKTADNVFAFGTQFVRRELPELYLYFSLSNASTFLLVDASSREIRNALYPFFDIRSDEAKQSGIVERVLRSRLDAPMARYRDLDLYSKKKITELGRKVPEFRAWLVSNGWKEADFEG